MKDFFQKLTDSIIIVDEKNNIEFVNNSFLNNIGYENNHLDLQEINNIVSIKNNKIHVFQNPETFKEGIIEDNHIQWEGKSARIIKIIWGNKLESTKQIMFGEAILDSMKLWFLVRDLNNKFVYINKACADYYDSNQERELKSIDALLGNEEFNKIIAKYDESVIRNKGNYIYEVERENGGIKNYYEINKFPILDGKGEVEYIGVYIRDISLFKNVQYKILDNLSLIDGNKSNNSLVLNKVDESIFENFRVIFNKHLSAENFNIWIYHKETENLQPYFPTVILKKEYENKSYFPVSKEEIKEYILGKDKKIVKISDEYGEYVSGFDEHYIFKYPIINQGEFKGIISMTYEQCPTLEVQYNDLIKTICNQIGFIIKYIELSRRINEELESRKKIEAELETFLEISADIFLKANENGVVEIGKGVFEILGWTEEQLKSMDLIDLIHPQDREKTQEIMSREIEGNEIVTFENRMKCADGLIKWVSWRSGNLINNKGYIFASGKDITSDKLVKEQQKEIEKSKQLEEVRNEFFANISHEFKTPINMIMATSQLMNKQLPNYELNNKVENDIRKHINIYKQNGYRLLRLVNNLIDITKIDAGFYKIKPININIISIVEEIVLSVVDFCEGNKIQLIFDTEVEEEIIGCDPDQIERIILNLLSNAIKYTPENGKIRVNIYMEKEYVVIKVEDTGTGISDEKLGVIFERFVQGDDNTLVRRGEGSGIGLSLVKGLVTMHDGYIDVSSKEGVGSVFQVKLPRKLLDTSNNTLISQEIKQSKVEKCFIEFADIYNL